MVGRPARRDKVGRAGRTRSYLFCPHNTSRRRRQDVPNRLPHPRSIFVVCTTIYISSLLIGWDDLGMVCLGARDVVRYAQLWRVLTSAVFHASLLHVAFNMLAFIPLGSALERHIGSLQLLWLIALLVTLGAALYLGAAYAAAAAGFPALLGHCAVGFSGVVFGLIPVEARYSNSGSADGGKRSIFGLFAVPTPVYPWALLALWTVLVPQSSFLGHVSGLAVGQAYAMGALQWAVPSGEAVQRLERSTALAGCVAAAAWVANTGSSGGGGGQGVTESLLPVSQPVGGDEPGPGSWLQGPWASFPGSALRPPLPPGAPTGPRGGRGAAGASSSGSLKEGPGVKGPVVGGPPAQQDPKAAAAAAAELRSGGAAG